MFSLFVRVNLNLYDKNTFLQIKWPSSVSLMVSVIHFYVGRGS